MHPGKPYPLMLRPFEGAPVGLALAPFYPDGEMPWTLPEDG